MPTVPNNLQRTKPIPEWALSIPKEIMASPFHLVRDCEVEWVNSLRFSTQCEFSAGNRHIMLDWSQVETIVRVFKIMRHYEFGEKYPTIDRVAVQLWKVLAWQHAANGDWILSEFFFKRYEASREEIGDDRTISVEPECVPEDKPLVQLICHFLIAHEMAHIWLDQSNAKTKRMRMALAHLSKMFPVISEAQEALGIVCFGYGSGVEQAVSQLGVDDLIVHREDLAEEIAADNLAHWWTCSIGRYGLDETTRGHLVGAIIGVEAAFGMLRDLARDDLNETANRIIVAHSEWALRAKVGVQAAAIEEILNLVPLWAANRFWFALAPWFWMPTPNSDIFVDAYLTAYRDLEQAAGVILNSTYFLNSIIAGKEELTAAFKEVALDRRIDHRRRLREV